MHACVSVSVGKNTQTVHENDKWRRRFFAPDFNVVASLRELCCVLKREKSIEEERREKREKQRGKRQIPTLSHSYIPFYFVKYIIHLWYINQLFMELVYLHTCVSFVKIYEGVLKFFTQFSLFNEILDLSIKSGMATCKGKSSSCFRIIPFIYNISQKERKKKHKLYF